MTSVKADLGDVASRLARAFPELRRDHVLAAVAAVTEVLERSVAMSRRGEALLSDVWSTMPRAGTMASAPPTAGAPPLEDASASSVFVPVEDEEETSPSISLMAVKRAEKRAAKKGAVFLSSVPEAAAVLHTLSNHTSEPDVMAEGAAAAPPGETDANVLRATATLAPPPATPPTTPVGTSPPSEPSLSGSMAEMLAMARRRRDTDLLTALCGKCLSESLAR